MSVFRKCWMYMPGVFYLDPKTVNPKISRKNLRDAFRIWARVEPAFSALCRFPQALLCPAIFRSPIHLSQFQH
jgi:hypothetical protein